MTRSRWVRAVLLVTAGTALTACSTGSTPPPGPASVRVVYRVEDSAQQPARVTTVVVEDAPPYRGRTRTLDGAPPGGTDLGGAAFDEAHQYLLGADGRVRTVQDVPPGFAGTASHLDVALAAAERHRLVRRVGGTATVAGRPCTTWLSRDPLDSGPFAAATAADSTRSCVGADGLLLREAWKLHGRLVRTRTAVSVGRGPSLAGAGLLSGRTPEPAPSSGPVQQVKVVTRQVLLTALAVPEPPAPQGLSPDREAAVIELDPDGQVGAEGGVLTWTDGKRLLVLTLQRGLTHRLVPPADGVPERLDGTRTARLVPTSYGLRLTFGAGSFVATVSTDLPEDALLTWAASLNLGR